MDTESSAATGQDADTPEITPADRAMGELMAARAIMSAVEQYQKRLSKAISIAPQQGTAAGLTAAHQALSVAALSAGRWAEKARRRLAEEDSSEEMTDLRERMERSLEGLTDLYLDNPAGWPEAQ